MTFSGGSILVLTPAEVTVTFPMHHTIEQAALEVWFAESQDAVSPTYKKVGSLIHHSGSGQALRSFTMDGVFPSKRGLPELDMANEGEMNVVEWTFQIDDLLPI